jgi:hypothetical protein
MIRFLIVFCFSIVAAAALAAPPRVVIFDFELVDTSLTGEMKGTSKDELARLAKMAPDLRERLAASGRYEIIPLGAEEANAKAANLQACGGCDVAMAKRLGADVAVTGTVRKASERLFTINVYLRDTKTGNLTQAASADIRENTDEAWTRGLSYLVRNRLLAPPDDASAPAAPEKASQ